MNLSPELEHYIHEHTSAEPEILVQLRKETYQKSIQPHMISGVLQGRLLSMISKLMQPENILEVGTFTGYSALCLAEGLSEGGTLVTIDKNPELEFISQKYIHQSDKNIEFLSGNALELIPTLEKTFDLIFLDADKDYYPDYIDLLLPKMHSGSIILADNILWKEKILDSSIQDKKTIAIKAFNQKIITHSELEVVILPIRDGISIIRRK